MDAFLVRRFVSEERENLAGASVQRLVHVQDGLLLVLQRTGNELLEVGCVAPPGAAWVWCGPQAVRSWLQSALASTSPDLVQPEPALGWRAEATPLDALRAWLLRPAPARPGWSQIEGCRVADLAAGGSDRILRFDLEKQDVLGRSERLQLVAELFDRGANIHLHTASGTVLANRSGRAPAVPRVQERDGSPEVVSRPERLVARAWAELAGAAAPQLAVAHRRHVRRQEVRSQRLLDKLDAEAATSAAAATWRELGELLSANLHRVRRGQSRVTVQDFFHDDRPRDIDLDPQRSPQDNAALFFKRARRGSRGRERVLARQAETRAALAALRASLQQIDGASGWAGILRAASETWRASCPASLPATAPAALWAPGGPAWGPAARRRARVAPEVQGPGRRFVLAGGWEVRVGRSNEENDELTHRFARPEDVWLHASGVAGSHVVLRVKGCGGNPPRDVLEAAAAIAAHFSKAKHARTVPVLWTRKRFVRKPRGAKPGLASCTQEKTVFVRPALPAAPAGE